MTRFLDWLKSRLWPEDTDSGLPGRHFDQDARRPTFRAKTPGSGNVARSSNHRPAAGPGPRPDIVDRPRPRGSMLENRGPGKNVLVGKEVRRDYSGTDGKLKILDDSDRNSEDQNSEDQQGFDPYNTGQFDRSRNWDKHTK
jgi:hypothetical protein